MRRRNVGQERASAARYEETIKEARPMKSRNESRREVMAMRNLHGLSSNGYLFERAALGMACPKWLKLRCVSDGRPYDIRAGPFTDVA